MKKKIAILAAALLLLSMAGCAAGTGEPDLPVETTGEPPAQTIAETAEAPAETAADPIPMETEETVPAGTEATEPFIVVISPVTTKDQKTVTVTTPDEFLAAIAPDTEIILDGELFDLSEASGYGETDGEYYYWGECFDGPELCIQEVSNLTIRGAGEDHNVNVVSSVPRYAHVLAFVNCSNIHTVGFTAGHTKEPGECEGGVLRFQNCQDVLVEDCGLFGCGTVGVTGKNSKNMQIVNNEIYSCSVGGLELMSCNDVNVDGNTFRDLGGPIFRMYDCGTVTCNGKDAPNF